MFNDLVPDSAEFGLKFFGVAAFRALSLLSSDERVELDMVMGMSWPRRRDSRQHSATSQQIFHCSLGCLKNDTSVVMSCHWNVSSHSNTGREGRENKPDTGLSVLKVVMDGRLPTARPCLVVFHGTML